ncbi:MAG: DNA repair protein [Candidatus Accumulibacter sp.]|jgi:DNA repair protein RadC|nr:DNA repair protein [Candidatus Accumulibacter necessarius]
MNAPTPHPLPPMTPAELAIIRRAMRLIESRLRHAGEAMTSPTLVKDLLRLRMAGLEREHFDLLLLDAQNRLVHVETLFVGTLTQTSVYPREVVKLALRFNAGAAIICHNHSSGFIEPSRADELLTGELKKALSLVEVRLLDHFIIAGNDVLSFAERGLI